MYKIEKKEFGIQVTFSDFIKSEEIEKYKQEFEKTLEELPDRFGVLVDMSHMKPLPPESQQTLMSVQKLVASRLTRSTTVFNSAIVNLQFHRMSKASGVIDSKRFIDASKTPNWQTTAVNWIANGVEP